MTKTRKLHELSGTIQYCLPGQVSSKGPHHNQPFYYLEIHVESIFTSRSESIYAFQNLVNKEVWQILKKETRSSETTSVVGDKTFKNKKYLFKCEKRVRGWRLREMKIIY